MSSRGMPSPGFYWHRLPPVRFKNGIVLIKNKRTPPREIDPVQYRLRFLPYLKDSVSEKGEQSSDVCCIQEMTLMLACFKKHEFQDEYCPKEIASFKKCFDDHLEGIKRKETMKGDGTLVQDAQRKYPAAALNKFLKQFPRQTFD